MIRLDSTKIKADISCIEGINTAFFNESNITDDNAVLKQCKELKQGSAVGLNNVRIDNINGTVEVLLSSKILYDHYAEGININTIEQAVDNINNTGIIQLNTEQFISTGVCLNTDETHPVKIDNLIPNWNDIATALACSIVNNKYGSTPYKRANNKGIVFSSDLASKKERLIMYCKMLDLNASKNKDFLKACSNPIQVLNDSKNVLRVESNNTSFNTIRQRFNLRPGAPLFHEVLTATGQPCLHYLNDITNPKKNRQLELIMQSEYTGRMFLEHEGINTIIRAAEYDEHAIKLVLESKFSYASFKAYWYGREGRPGIKQQIINLRAQDNRQQPGALNPIMIDIVKQLQTDYAI
jgi:hypothetical protein